MLLNLWYLLTVVSFIAISCDETTSVDNGLWLSVHAYCCGRNSQPRQGSDMMNYEQKSTRSDQGHALGEK
jgi:hypothetical protein